jgi:hypothetical protein
VSLFTSVTVPTMIAGWGLGALGTGACSSCALAVLGPAEQSRTADTKIQLNTGHFILGHLQGIEISNVCLPSTNQTQATPPKRCAIGHLANRSTNWKTENLPSFCALCRRTSGRRKSVNYSLYWRECSISRPKIKNTTRDTLTWVQRRITSYSKR